MIIIPEAAQTPFSYAIFAQGTALFMSRSLLAALAFVKHVRHQPTASAFTFQHGLCHDLESLIWVVVYAMMIHQRNIFAATDQGMFGLYKEELDHCWAAHAYSSLQISHNHMVMTGCTDDSLSLVRSWFPDPREAAFFCEAMRLILYSQIGGGPITYEALCALFKKHINLAEEQQVVDVVSN